jgi:tripartite ATP-independent transporter DctM subunit
MMLDPAVVGGLMIAGMLLLLFSGMPIAFALATSGLAGLAATRPWPSVEFLLSSFPYTRSADLAYIVLPLFLFMGNMAFAAGVAGKAFDAARSWFGALPGGLAIATVFACAAFAAVSGSSIATSATIAQIAIPEMLKSKYPQRIAAGCVAAGGTLGVLVPPSGILIVYSIVTEVSLSDMFRAAIIPGVLTAVAYAFVLYYWVRRSPVLREATLQAPDPWPKRVRLLLQSWEVVLIFAVVMGTIYLGIGTATEAAAFGAAVSLAIVLVRRGGQRRRILWRGLVDTGVTTSSIFALIIGAGIFGLGLSTTQVPQELAAWMAGFKLPMAVLTFMLLAPYLVLGCFIDGISMLLVTLPVVFPIVKGAGINPVLFGILVAKTIEIAAIHPPVGLNAFVVKNSVPGLKLSEVFLGCAPFVVMEIVLTIVLVLFPQLTIGLGQ